jgi:hypothetical protein
VRCGNQGEEQDMTNAELDTMWFQAQHDAIKAGEDFTRYRFAALVAAAERETCAKVCEAEYEGYDWADRERDGAEACAAAIRARNKT